MTARGDGVGTFAALLQRHRQAAGLSQEELAERARLSRRGISDLERGIRRLPHPATVRRLAAALRLRQTEQATLLAALGRHHARRQRAQSVELPLSLTSFVGREHELVEVRGLLGATRLLTLTGAGGIGKTRLVLEAARASAPEEVERVCLVELAPVTDPCLLVGAVAAALGVGEQAGRSLSDTLIEVLRHERVLLLLDNCEHLVEACAELAELLLRNCSAVRILATSRERLGVDGETVWRVPPLAVPPSDSPAEALLGCEAVRLFVDRASTIAPGFSLTAENGPTVAALCRRLDGIPLAIELAAARVNLLSVEQIAARLDDAMRLLVGGSRTAPARQQTLRATFEWSYGLLTEPEQLLLARASVFVGGWTLEAAEAVCGDEGTEALLHAAGLARRSILDLLGHLVDKSLVLVEPGVDGALRYRLLEPLRQFAGGRLSEQGTEDVVRRRHARWFAGLAAQAVGHYHGPAQVAALERLELEHANVQVALAWLFAHEGVEPAARLATALLWFWVRRDHWQEARGWYETLVAAADSGRLGTAQAELLFAAGQIAWLQGDFSAASRWVEESLTAAARCGEAGAVALGPALALAGRLAAVRGEYETAGRLFEAGLAAVRAGRGCWSEPLQLEGLANIALQQGDCDRAMTLLDTSLAVARGRGDDWALATVLNALGDVARGQGDYGQAKRRYQESLALHERLGSHPRATRASVLHNLGYVAVHEGDLGRAVELFSASLRLYQRRGERRGLTECLVGLGSAAAAAGRPEQAARLFGAAEACFEDLGTRLSPSNRTDYERALARTRAGLDPERFAPAWQAGRRLALEDAVGEALETAPLSARSQPAQPPSLPSGGTASSRSPGAPRSQPRVLGRRRSGGAPTSRLGPSHLSSAPRPSSAAAEARG